MERVKITMLGISGAGKSSFFSGVYHSLITGTVKAKDNSTVVSLCGVDDDGSVNRLTALSTAQVMEQYKIDNIMGNREGTWDISEFNFMMDIMDSRFATYQIPIHIFDYRGGLLQNVNNEDDKAEAEILMTKVIDSHVLLIMADAIQLTNNANNAIKRKEKTGADRINPVIKSILPLMKKENVTVLLLLTKSDSERIDLSYKKDDYKKMKELARETFDTVFAYSEMLKRDKNWNFGIVPITAVGEGNVITRFIEGGSRFVCELKKEATPKQKNVDNVIIYSVYQALKNNMSHLEREIDKCTEILEQCKKFSFDFRHRKQLAERKEEERRKLKQENELCCKSVMALNEGFGSEFSSIKCS